MNAIVPAVSLIPLNADKAGPVVATPRCKADPAVRDAVREIMAAHSLLHGPLTARLINERLPEHLRRTDGDIRHHVRAIRAESH